MFSAIRTARSSKKRWTASTVAALLVASSLVALAQADSPAFAAASGKVVQARTSADATIPNNGSVTVNTITLTSAATAASSWSIVAKATLRANGLGLMTCKVMDSALGELDTTSTISSSSQDRVPTNIAARVLAAGATTTLTQVCSHLNPFTLVGGGTVTEDASLIAFKTWKNQASTQYLERTTSDITVGTSPTFITGGGPVGHHLVGVRLDAETSSGVNTEIECSLSSGLVSGFDRSPTWKIGLPTTDARASVAHFSFSENTDGYNVLCRRIGPGIVVIKAGAVWLRRQVPTAVGSIGACGGSLSAPASIALRALDQDSESACSLGALHQVALSNGTWLGLSSFVVENTGSCEMSASGNPVDRSFATATGTATASVTSMATFAVTTPAFGDPQSNVTSWCDEGVSSTGTAFSLVALKL